MRYANTTLPFVETIERYNALCDAGQDLDFGKKAESLKPIRRPPFYAFWGQRFSEVSHGGIAVTPDGEVLDVHGNVMPGLFAGGDGTTIFGGSGGRPPGGTFPSGPPKAVPFGSGAPKGFADGSGSPGGGLSGAVTSGYLGGIAAGKYLAAFFTSVDTGKDDKISKAE